MTKHRDRADDICDYIDRYTGLHGYPPSVREIARANGLASTSAAFHWLERLREEGRVRSTPGVSRSFVVIHE